MEAVARSVAACPKAVAFSASAELKGAARSSVSFGGSRGNAVAAKVPALRGAVARRPVVCMSKPSAAAGYAAALLDVGKGTKSLEAIHTDLETLSAVVNSPEMQKFLSNPVLSDDKKKTVIKSLASEGNFNPYTVNFLNVLVDKRRISSLRDIIAIFEELYCDATDTQVAIVTSAVKLENSQQALIAKKLQSMTGAKNIKLKNVIDPALIAGFVVKYGRDGSQFIDMSVKGQLDRLADQLDLSEGGLLAA